MRPWQECVPEEERAVYQKAGYWGREPRLEDHPALLIIDVTQAFTGGPDPDHHPGYDRPKGGGTGPAEGQGQRLL